jgi:hypothetical protein
VIGAAVVGGVVVVVGGRFAMVVTEVGEDVVAAATDVAAASTGPPAPFDPVPLPPSEQAATRYEAANIARMIDPRVIPIPSA